MKGRKRHIIFWQLLRPVIALLVKIKFNFKADMVELDKPTLILSNHNTDWDALLVGGRIKQQVYFVASEHIFRWGLATKLIRFFLDPIARLKASTAADTALNVIRRVRKGANVCIFAEGNRSFDGKTCDILPATGKLAKSCNGNLMTYRLVGGYFSSPRWSGSTIRRGEMRGEVVRIYTPEELKAMSVDEINEAIKRDLYEDAYARQEQKKIPFKGRNLAHGLERMLCICPTCHQYGTLKSEGDTLLCSCGFRVRYDIYGYLIGENNAFDTIQKWDSWQTEYIGTLCKEESSEAIFTDSNIICNELQQDHRFVSLGVGSLSLYRDRFCWNDKIFYFNEITGIAIHGPQSIDLACGNRHFEFKSESVYCARKYLTAFSCMNNNTDVSLV